MPANLTYAADTRLAGNPAAVFHPPVDLLALAIEYYEGQATAKARQAQGQCGYIPGYSSRAAKISAHPWLAAFPAGAQRRAARAELGRIAKSALAELQLTSVTDTH